MKLSKNVPTYTFGAGAFATLRDFIENHQGPGSGTLFLVDSVFKGGTLAGRLTLGEKDHLFWISTDDEPTTDGIDDLTRRSKEAFGPGMPKCVVGIGGGITLDTAKAVSNLLSNGGSSEDYQGWDLVRVPGIFKVGVPTISGTGAEASRTCVLTNLQKNIKLGMNSEHSVFDHLVLDPDLSATVDRNQYFYTAMDTYIHCVESLRGHYRHALADAFSNQALALCREIFFARDMMGPVEREKLMVASYLGGASIANTFVGVVHPLSAGLSTVLKLHHCVGNCIVMNVMDEFYPAETAEFKSFLDAQKVKIPAKVCANLNDDQFMRLYESAIVHEKPLVNALGTNYRNILTPEKVISIYRRM